MRGRVWEPKVLAPTTENYVIDGPAKTCGRAHQPGPKTYVLSDNAGLNEKTQI